MKEMMMLLCLCFFLVDEVHWRCAVRPKFNDLKKKNKEEN